MKVTNVITSPEIEVLMFIAAGCYDNYKNKKSTMKPSEYCKKLFGENIKSYDFVKTYFQDVNTLISAITTYHHKTQKNKKYQTLYDLIDKKYVN